MKRIISVLLCCLLILSAFIVSSCGGDKEDNNDGNNNGEAVVARYSANETAAKLKASDFTDATLQDVEYGLNNESTIGVEKDKYLNEVLYPISSDQNFEGTVLFWETFGKDEYENTPSGNFEKLKAIINYVERLNAAGVKVKLNMPTNATIDLDVTLSENGHFAIVSENLNGFYLQGNNCLFNIWYPDFEWRGFISLRQCEDVWFENVKIDYEVSNAITGKILSYDIEDCSVDLLINPEFNEFVERLIDKPKNICSYLEYNRITKAPFEGGNYDFVDSSSTGAGSVFKGYEFRATPQGYVMTIKFICEGTRTLLTVAEGHLANVAFSYYVYNCIDCQSCGDLHFENLTIYSSPAMGFVSRESRNVYLNRLNIILPENTSRLMTTNADGVHIQQLRGEVVVTNSTLEYNQDDALNIKSGYFYKLDKSGIDLKNRTIRISRATESMGSPKKDDVIEIYDKDTFAFKASLTVEEVSGSVLAYTVKVKESLAQLNIMDWGDCVATNTNGPRLVLQNNIIRNKRNRGVLCLTRNVKIENNTLRNVAQGSIFIMSFMDNFNEGTVPKNVLVRNNKLINNNYEKNGQGDILVSAAYYTNSFAGIAPAGTITDVVIENNFIAENGASAVALLSSRNCSINNNYFYETCRAFKSNECAVYISNSTNVNLNYNYNKSMSDTQMGVLVQGTSQISDVNSQSNYGLEITNEAYKKEIVEIHKYGKGTFTVDGNLSDWSDIGTDIEMIAASYPNETRADSADYSSNFEIKQAKIAWCDDGIFIAFSVKDNDIDIRNINNFWYGDCVEIIATAYRNFPNDDIFYSKNSDDTLQIVCTPEWSDLHVDRTSDNIYENKDLIIEEVRYTADGYDGEIYIPFSVCGGMKNSIDAGNYLTFNVVFMDAQRNGRSRIQIANVPHWVETNKKCTAKSFEYVFVN